MLLFRVVVLGLFVYIFKWPLAKIISGNYGGSIWLFAFGLLAVCMFPVYIIWTLLGVMSVKVFDDESGMRFQYLLRSKEVRYKDIEGYYKTIFRTKVARYDGLLIKLKSGETIEVTEYNLKSIEDIAACLDKSQIPEIGTMASWFPLKRKVK